MSPPGRLNGELIPGLLEGDRRAGMGGISTEREHEILDAALRLIAVHGYDAVTLDRIAKEAACSKATLYRRWDSKAAIVVNALEAIKRDPQQLPDTGSFPDDLREAVRLNYGAYAGQSVLMVSLFYAAVREPRIGEALRTHMMTYALNGFDRLIERAVERGEVAPSLATLDHARTLMLSPFVLSPVFEGREPGPDGLAEWVDGVILPVLGFRVELNSG